MIAAGIFATSAFEQIAEHAVVGWRRQPPLRAGLAHGR
jgi:hypothetical protein